MNKPMRTMVLPLVLPLALTLALPLAPTADAHAAASPCDELAKRIGWAPQAQGKAEPTAQVRRLFDAANAGDEATFAALLAATPNVNAYVVDGDKLLHRLLSPARSLVDDESAWREQHRMWHVDPADPPHWAAQQSKHAALHAAKTRMLALALRAGASVNEAGQDGLTPLHLVAMYGTADMVRQLVAAGADVRQVEPQSNREPLELTVDQERAGYLARLSGLVRPEDRTATILALLDAGAPLPGQRVGELSWCRMKERKEQVHEDRRPSADYLMWNDLLALTRGRAVLDRMTAVGTRPYTDEGSGALFAHAAWGGNAEGIGWLKEHVPRMDKEGKDAWTEGAMWALAGLRTAPPGAMDGVLDALLVPGLPWDQRGPADVRSFSRAQRHQPRTQFQAKTLLEHAILSGRVDVVQRLVKLGAPIASGSGALRQVVTWGDVPMLRALLALGMSPLADDAEALRLAITPEEHPYTEGLLDDRPVTQRQRTEMVELMLDTLRQRKLAVPEDARLLDEALRHARTADGARLARAVLDAGAPVEDLTFDGVRNVLRSPDKALFGDLLQRGFLRAGADSDDETRTYAGATLREAILAGRPDVIPALLALRPDLAWRGEDGLSVMDVALRQGDVATVETLLTAGGTLDASAMDHALVSGKDPMMRFAAAKTGQTVADTCVADTVALAEIVRTADDVRWASLRQQGFGAQRCPDMAPRLIDQYAQQSVVFQVAGWLAERLKVRLAELRADRPAAVLDESTIALLREPNAVLLLQVLRDAGWPVAAGSPQVDTRSAAQRAADKKLQASLVGDYEVAGREIGGGIRLRRDGTFQYGLVYGAVDEALQGSWRVENGKLHLASAAGKAGTLTYTLEEDSDAAAPPAGQIAIDVLFRGRAVPRMRLMVFGDAPALAYGDTGARGRAGEKGDTWRGTWSGPVRQIVLSHDGIDNGRPYVFDVPAAQAQRTRFVLRLPDVVPTSSFDHALFIKGDTLVWPREDGNFPFERKRTTRK